MLELVNRSPLPLWMKIPLWRLWWRMFFWRWRRSLSPEDYRTLIRETGRLVDRSQHSDGWMRWKP